MVKIFIPVCVVFVTLSFAGSTHAQFQGSNIAEYQFGNIPTDTTLLSTMYDRLVGYYNYKSFKVGATLEQFNTPRAGSNYIKLSQFSLLYKKKPFEVKIGNFYETIGRGTLLRSFEIPGAVLEDISYRSRHYFNRDILGASAKYQHKNLIIKALYGSPLNYVFPPNQGFENRRADRIAALYSEYNLKKQTLGASIMRHSNSGNDRLFAMLTSSGNILKSFSYYTEFSKNISDFSIVDFSNNSSYAIYGSLNFSHKELGVSLEYKNYKNVLIGSGINEPPALIKEHTYRVLNRSTHVLQPIDETGYQLEIFYFFENLSKLTFNHAIAINNFGNRFVFQEYFLEYDFYYKDKHDFKLFVDYAQDPFKLEENRISSGLGVDWEFLKASTIRTEYEFQTFNRLNENFTNHVFVLGYAFRSKLICNVVAEYSNDSFIVTSGSKIWFGGNVKYQLNRKNNLQLFVGERRGGPACNAGVCYEVLDFKGVELRLTSRF